jgi:2'-5' RNA ligase
VIDVTQHDIGVAIGIPEPFRSELQGWRERLGDPNAAFIIPHVTLLSPIRVPDRQLGEIERHLAEVAAAGTPFQIHLRGSGTFRPLSQVVFVALARGISRCETLQEAVRSGPLARTLRFAYHPHVTVAQDIDNEGLDRAKEALATYDARFEVAAFGLYECGDDQMWRELRRFPLTCPSRSRAKSSVEMSGLWCDRGAARVAPRS